MSRICRVSVWNPKFCGVPVDVSVSSGVAPRASAPASVGLSAS